MRDRFIRRLEQRAAATSGLIGATLNLLPPVALGLAILSLGVLLWAINVSHRLEALEARCPAPAPAQEAH